MKRFILLFSIILCSFGAVSFAQNPTYQQKLYYTCKVWGFVKYFHSNVSTCGVNWDSVLIHCLPLVKNAITDSAFNDALDTMLLAAGPMALTLSPRCDTMAPELKRNLNFGWINNLILRTDVQTILDTIKNNFRPHVECWVKSGYPSFPNGYLTFPKDDLMLNVNDKTNYPDEWHRLLELFKHWNIINYFNPYNYIEDQPWDSTLFQNVLYIDTASNDASFFTSFCRITHNMDDMHVQAFTYDNYCYSPAGGEYYPALVLKYIPHKYIVVKSGIGGITNGDEILSINGLTTKQWEDSLGPYISAGDSAAFHVEIPFYMMGQAFGSNITVTYLDSLNNNHTTATTCTYFATSSWIRSYYPNDTLANVQWRYWSNCNIGYVNVGKMKDIGSDVATMYSALQNTNAIIFDIRDYTASNAVFDICDNYLFNTGVPAVEYMAPDITYPGTFYWFHQYFFPGTSNPYKGRVIVLFNEQAISAAENAAMQLGEVPNALKIGSQTDGTDGNITFFNLSQDMGTGFTSLGWFYPNGDSTERVGIKPDSIVYPTQKGIRAGKDEVLEKALQVCGCPLAIPNISTIKASAEVYPDPNSGDFSVMLKSVTEPLQMEIYNTLGEKVYSSILYYSETQIHLDDKATGIYLYRLLDKNEKIIATGKFAIK